MFRARRARPPSVLLVVMVYTSVRMGGLLLSRGLSIYQQKKKNKPSLLKDLKRVKAIYFSSYLLTFSQHPESNQLIKCSDKRKDINLVSVLCMAVIRPSNHIIRSERNEKCGVGG